MWLLQWRHCRRRPSLQAQHLSSVTRSFPPPERTSAAYATPTFLGSQARVPELIFATAGFSRSTRVVARVGDRDRERERARAPRGLACAR